MLWLLAGYMWLFIHRPFEVWPWLAEYRIERVYMIFVLIVGAISGKLTFPTDRLSCAFAAFFLVMLASWTFSPFPLPGEKVVEGYLKVAVFYVLVASYCRSEKDLRFVVTAFLVCMVLYMGHSLREYYNGRHQWAMGTHRMIGVDLAYNDPNTFAATILYSLPMLIPFWLDSPATRTRLLVGGYIALALTCILLTGSRTAFVMTAILGSVGLILVSKHKLRIIIIGITVAVTAWSLLPEDRRLRFMTVLDPSLGPANAQESAELRSVFFWQAVDLWQQNPLLGVGPGAFGSAMEHGMAPHVLYGEVISELGTGGVIAFLAIVATLILNYRRATNLVKLKTLKQSHFSYYVALSVAATVVLLLAMGVGGNNLYRYTWMWYGAFQLIALRIVQSRARTPAVMVPTPSFAMGTAQ